MIRGIALVGALLTLTVPAAGQHPVRGTISGAGVPLAAARVEAVGATTIRTLTAVDGAFVLMLAEGRWELRVTAIGHRPVRHTITVPEDVMVGTLDLEPLAAELEQIVVTGTMQETTLADSPVKVELVLARALRRNLTNNLMESVRTLPGLQEQVDCGVCYTNSIRINGMEGPYTAVLIDGVPLMSALATTYGFNGINPAILDRVEVVKGPASTLYGSEAMGGVINVITRDPRFAPRWSLTTYATSHGEVSTDLAAAPTIGNTRLLLSGSLARNERFVDANADNFSDLPLVTRGALFAKWAVGSAERRAVDLSARIYHEDRFGGVRGWNRSDRGSGTVYGESIRTNRQEVIAGITPGWLDGAARLDIALNRHRQDSWYGTARYVAAQDVAFAQATWLPRGNGVIRPLAGLSARYLRYDDDTPATTTADRRVVPGVFAELEAAPHPRLTVLGGGRLDHHADHGLVPSPRVALKWDASDRTTARLNVATGFRVVNLFTEDHAALSGSRQVVIAEALDPERSVTATASLRHASGVGAVPFVAELDIFATRFSNRIQPDYDTDPGQIIYRNLDGTAWTRGITAAISVDPAASPIAGRASASWQRVTRTDAGVTADIPFAASFKGDFTLTWAVQGDDMVLDWTGRLVGPMALPRHPGRAARSPWFTEQNVQLTRRIIGEAFLIAGVKNLFDTRQRDPLVAPEDPFGPDFDTNFVWGPTQGRRVMVGFQWNAAR
jgi:outer membrane receptor for ferrienterochelin and colicins